jgi:endonuclease/exonuclease/phosphatase family metal-dependent hydrolase
MMRTIPLLALVVLLQACPDSPGGTVEYFTPPADTPLHALDVSAAQDVPADRWGADAVPVADTADPPPDAAPPQDTPAPSDLPPDLAPPPASWTVLTYNLHCHHDDPAARMALVAAEAVSRGAEVLLLQEVCEGAGLANTADTLAELLEGATGDDWTALTQSTHLAWDTYEEGLGLVTAGTVIDWGSVALPPGLFPRKALHARIEATDGPMDAVVTHLSFGDQAAVRRVQAEALATWIEQAVLPGAPGPVVLGGDFNDVPGSPPLAVFTAWTEAWAATHPGDPGKTYPAGAATSKIDHILLHPGSGAAFGQAALVFDEEVDGGFPSDHYGIVATLTR